MFQFDFSEDEWTFEICQEKIQCSRTKNARIVVDMNKSDVKYLIKYRALVMLLVVGTAIDGVIIVAKCCCFNVLWNASYEARR